ncbi:hypothetical protein I4U23_002035 [Adineta vaga]|nr:hypothetical protein I4U23_002035 [Adineta vaga]
MHTDNSWQPTVPMTNQPLTSFFETTNHGFVPTVESIRTQSTAAPSLPQRTIPQSSRHVGPYPPMNYPNTSYSQQPTYYNNHYLSSSNPPMSNFTQLAIDESRSAFNSIESIIQTFHSISHMFESTFTNIYTSFRAMIDLFDHFTRLRSELTTLYPVILLYRFMKFLYHRLLKVFHLRKSDQFEDSWMTIYHSLQQTTESTKTTNGQSSSLLVALFFLVSFGTPMLMLKVLNSIIKKQQINNNRLQQDTKQARVVALHDYVAQNSDELSFTRGTTIYLAPPAFQFAKSSWFLGTIDHIHMGLIPANYVQPIRTNTSSKISQRFSDVNVSYD